MTTTEILNEISKLPPGERHSIFKRLDDVLHHDNVSPEELREREFEQMLLAEGVIREIPSGWNEDDVFRAGRNHRSTAFRNYHRGSRTMSVLFLDSSAITKKYVSALTRRRRGHSLSATDLTKVSNRFRRNFTDKFFKTEINLSVIEQAAALAEKHALRGYDAVQLASAFNLHSRRQKFGLPPLVFVSADHAPNTAASAEGLQVDNPNNHP